MNKVTIDGQEIEYKLLFIDGSESRPEAYRFVTADQTIAAIPRDRNHSRPHGVPSVFDSSMSNLRSGYNSRKIWLCPEQGSVYSPATRYDLHFRPHTVEEQKELALAEHRAMTEPPGSVTDTTGCKPRNPQSPEQNKIAGITEEPNTIETLERLAQAQKTLSSGVLYTGKGTADMPEEDRFLFNLLREMNPSRKGWALSYREIGHRLNISQTELGRRRRDFESRFPNFVKIIAEARQKNDGKIHPDRCDSGRKIKTKNPPENPSEPD